jgi:hypothetical protein
MFHGRGKNKIQNPDNMSDIYEAFVKEFNGEPPYDISRTEFVAINDAFYRRAVEKILAGNTLQLPFGVGRIQIEKTKATKFKGSKMFIDWENTNKIGKVVYHLNEHSNGYNYHIRWRKPGMIRGDKKYRFIAARMFRRTLAKIIKNRELDYFES